MRGEIQFSQQIRCVAIADKGEKWETLQRVLNPY